MSHSIWSVGGLELNGRTVPSFNTIWVYIFSWLLFVSHLTRFVLDDNFSLSLHIFSSSSSLGAKGLSVFIHLIVSVWIYFRYSLHNKYIKVFHTDTQKIYWDSFLSACFLFHSRGRWTVGNLCVWSVVRDLSFAQQITPRNGCEARRKVHDLRREMVKYLSAWFLSNKNQK